jgi:RNA polymerase sigma-70 factor (subfamily 1)
VDCKKTVANSGETTRIAPRLGVQTVCEKINYINEEPDLDALLKAARLGIPGAINDLFLRVQNYLTYIAERQFHSSLRAKAGSSDVVQQTMLRATCEFEKFRGESGDQFRGWLRQILINEVKLIQRHFGAVRRNPSKEQPLGKSDSEGSVVAEPIANSPTPSEVAMAAEDAERLRKVLHLLSPQMRQVIQLKNWERLQFNEIGERMGLSLSQAAKLWYQALEELKRLNSIQ